MRFPTLQFLTARHETPALDLWSKFGPPSRMHRWCCSVYKSAPVVRLLQQLKGDGTQARVLLFDGVRSDESERRSSYARITPGGKSVTQTNASVIQLWSSTEVYLYIWRRSLILNQGYRDGLARVGCAVCPFSSSGTERVIAQAYPDVLAPYREALETYAATQGVQDSDMDTYLNNGDWKKRAGGAGIDSEGSRVDFTMASGQLRATVKGGSSDDVLEWLKAIGTLSVTNWQDGVRRGIIAARSKSINFSQEQFDGASGGRIVFDHMAGETEMAGLIQRALTKAAYCVQCGVCTVQCPTGALTVSPRVHIDEARCEHCGRCLTFSDKGCLRAKSLATSQVSVRSLGGSGMGTYAGFSRYQTFGLRREWLDGIMMHGVEWIGANSLGNRQRDSAVIWFRESGLIEPVGKGGVFHLTELGELCRPRYTTAPNIVWGLVLINLAHASGIVRWYVAEVPLGDYSTSDLYQRLSASCGDNRSSHNGLNALLNLLKTSPLGDVYALGVSHGTGRSSLVRKAGAANVPAAVLLFSLYRYAEERGSYDFTVSQLVNEGADSGPAKEFGLSRDALVSRLREISTTKAANYVHVDLLGGLDNISLERGLPAVTALERFWSE